MGFRKQNCWLKQIEMTFKRSFIIFLVVFVCVTACKKDENTVLELETSFISDVDGNTYKTVKIGDQWWMTENLNVKHFNDGSELNYVAIFQDDTLWANSVGPSYTYLNDSIYGCLYNQSAVQDVRKLSPAGWHVATDDDWKKLEETIGMSSSEVEKLAWRGVAEAENLLPINSEGWPIQTVPFGSNKYKMNVLPSGCKLFNGQSSTNGNAAFFWTSTKIADEAYYRHFDYKQKTIYRQHTYNQYGMSIRCVKD